MTPEFAIFARPNGMTQSRLGVTATRRLGKAVVRNRARRLVREAYRTHRDEFPAGFDLVVVAHAPLLDKSAEEMAPLLVRAAGEAASQADGEGAA